MSAPRLYDITSREVSPVSELLKAVVELNWHLTAAECEGWNVSLEVDKCSGKLGVTVNRTEGWPSLESETSEAEA